jgi:hypothetical protein
MEPLNAISEKQVSPPHPYARIRGSHKKIFLRIYPEGGGAEIRNFPN